MKGPERVGLLCEESSNKQKHPIENCASGMEQPRFPEETLGRN